MACAQEADRIILNELAGFIRGENGIVIADRSNFFRTYRSVFVGSEVVDWLIANHFATQREAAVALGNEMLQKGIFHHISFSHIFKDDGNFYRFPEDDPLQQKMKYKGPSAASLLNDCGVTKVGWVHRIGTLFTSRRYLMVKQDEGVLYYFKSNLDPSPRLAIQLNDGVSVREELNRCKKGCYCFSVRSAVTTMTFVCENSRDQEAWIESLVEAGIDLEETSIDPSAGSSIYEFSCPDIDGVEVPFANFKGQVCLVVNVATK